MRKDYLAPLAERNPEAAALLEKRVLAAGQQGYATSDGEIHEGVFAASAQVLQGKRMAAVITVPAPEVRVPTPEQRAQIVTEVRIAARAITEGLRAARR